MSCWARSAAACSAVAGRPSSRGCGWGVGEPVLVVWGREDRIVPAHHAGSAPPGATVEGAGGRRPHGADGTRQRREPVAQPSCRNLTPSPRPRYLVNHHLKEIEHAGKHGQIALDVRDDGRDPGLRGDHGQGLSRGQVAAAHPEEDWRSTSAPGRCRARCTSRPGRSRWRSASARTCSKEDTVVGTHRPHHFAIAKGVPLDQMTAEMFGKVTGLGKGKGGHMHLFDPEHKFSCSGIIGASLPPACGAALAAKKLRQGLGGGRLLRRRRGQPGLVPRVAEPGRAVEAAGGVRLRRQQVGDLGARSPSPPSIAWNADRAAAYGMPGILVANNDALEVYEAAGAADRARAARRGPDPDRGEDRPLPGPLPGRPGGLPAQGRGRRTCARTIRSRSWRAHAAEHAA